ncbi:protein adenylyltransferase SelO [Methylobacterium radiodurans]|uniref:Protein nucleotidyltransferase YdiU n=1 Tax=Methylobacterium radiodurans TaxID=2202828 RepID=A0A2U8VWU5_9HYPH|nr:YdiU family protein [Methylobacterium radiodurans]AWN38267.1 YdiU family protein [Methylobacterium radiodurans]
MSAPLAFDNSYARLPDRFFRRLAPTPVADPRLIKLNRDLALSLGLDLDWLAGPEGVAMFAGNRMPEGAEPLAAAYAGHQFGNFVPQLGDGRAILLGEVTDRDGRRRDIQLKGSGPTPFSRHADGRAAIGPVLREYLVSESMAALGIPTTRALAAVTTGEPVMRERVLPGAVLTRVASSHIRVGTFQFFAARGDTDGLRALADHVIARHYPEAGTGAEPYRALLEGVIGAQADLVARWLLVGFVHGVMNTDNMSVAGETIDYGPCAFLDAYDARTTFSSIDQNGRYAYGNQPRIALWNLSRLAEALLPLLAETEDAAVIVAEAALGGFAPSFEAAYHGGLARKIGLPLPGAGDAELAGDLLRRMAENQADFTLTFRRLADAAADPAADGRVRDLFVDPTAYDAWALRWRERLGRDARGPGETAAAMRAVNPAFIPRNHRVEAVIEAAVERADLGPFEELLRVLAQPYADQPDFARYAEAPEGGGVGYRTFCGT